MRLRSRRLHLGLVCIPTLSRLVWPVVFLRPSMNNGTHSKVRLTLNADFFLRCCLTCTQITGHHSTEAAMMKTRADDYWINISLRTTYNRPKHRWLSAQHAFKIRHIGKWLTGTQVVLPNQVVWSKLSFSYFTSVWLQHKNDHEQLHLCLEPNSKGKPCIIFTQTEPLKNMYIYQKLKQFGTATKNQQHSRKRCVMITKQKFWNVHGK